MKIKARKLKIEQKFTMNNILLVLCWVFFGLVCSKLARKKNRKPSAWFLLGLFFGMIALIIILFLKPRKIIKKSPTSPDTIIDNFQFLSADNNYWYYLDDEKKQIGPMSVKRLFNNYLNGKISDATFVWNDTMENWKKLSEVSIFSKILQQNSTN